VMFGKQSQHKLNAVPIFIFFGLLEGVLELNIKSEHSE
jgi:hypothetical protein